MNNLCVKCGESLEVNAKFCGYCGHPVDSEIHTSSASGAKRGTHQAAQNQSNRPINTKVEIDTKSDVKHSDSSSSSKTDKGFNFENWTWILIPVGALLIKFLFGE